MALNLGNITFGLGVDTNGLDKAMNTVSKFGAQVSTAMRTSKGDIDETTRALMAQEAAAVKGLMAIQQQIFQIQRSNIDPSIKTDQIAAASAAYEKFAKAITTAPPQTNLNPLGMQRVQLGFEEQMQYQKQALQTAKDAETAGRAEEAQWTRQAIAIQRAESQLTLFQDQVNRAAAQGKISPKQAESFNTGASDAVRSYAEALRSSQMSTEQFVSEQLKLKEALTMVQREFSSAAQGPHILVASFGALQNAFSMVGGPMGTVAMQLQQSTALMKEHGIAIGGSIAALAAFAAGSIGAVEALSHATIEYEKVLQVQTAVTNSTEMGAVQFKVLVDAARQSGTSLEALTPAFNRFVASAVGSGTSVHAADTQFRNLAVTFGVMHLSSQDSANALKAFDEIMSRGYVTSRDLVTRLSNDFPAAMNIAKHAMGASGAALEEMLKKGQVSGPAFVKAFQDAAAELYHIDLAKPVDTLQAALGRISTDWDVFLIKIGMALDASHTFKGGLDLLSQGLTWLGENVRQVMSLLAGLIGAMAGLLIAQGLITIFVGLAKAIDTAVKAYEALTIAIKAGTVAQLLFDAALDANPIGAVVAAIVVLTGIIFGATAAYNLMNNAIKINQAQQADTSGIDAFITKSNTEKTQIKELTQLYLDKAKAALVATQASVNDTAPMEEAQAKLKRFQDAGKVMDRGGNQIDYSQAIKGQQEVIGNLQKDQQARKEVAAHIQSQVTALEAILKKPEDNTVGPGSPKVGGNTGKSPGVGAAEQLVAGAQAAKEAMDSMFRTPMSAELITTINTAQAKVKAIGESGKDAAQNMNELVTIMSKSDMVKGISGAANQYSVLSASIKIAGDNTKAYNKIWEDVSKGVGDLKGYQDQLKEINNEGAKQKPWLVEGAKQAEQELTKLNTGSVADLAKALSTVSGLSKEAQDRITSFAASAQNKGLDAVVALMKELGFDISHTGDVAKDAQADLTAFFASINHGKIEVQQAESAMKSLKASLQALKDVQKQQSNIGLNGQQTQQADWAQQGAAFIKPQTDNKSLDSLASILKLTQSIKDAGVAFQQATTPEQTFINAFVAMKQKSDDAAAAIKTWNGILADRVREWQNFGNKGVDALQGILLGTMKVKDAVKGVLNDLIVTTTNTALFAPLKANLAQAIGDAVQGKGVGGFSIGNLFQGVMGMGKDATLITAQTLNTTATNLNTTAITTLLVPAMTALTVATGVAAGASAGGGSATLGAAALMTFAATGGLMGSLQRFAGGGGTGRVSGPGTGTSDSIMAMISNGEFIVNAQQTAKFLPLLHAINSGKMPHHAAGGYVGTNDLYSASYGASVQSGQLTGSQGSAIIDAKSNIVINGNADSVTLRDLKAHLDSRDQRLKAQMPIMVDARVQDSIVRGRYNR